MVRSRQVLGLEFERFAVEIVLIGWQHNPDSKVHGANMGPIWGRQDPGGPHVGPMNFAIWEAMPQIYHDRCSIGEYTLLRNSSEWNIPRSQLL